MSHDKKVRKLTSDQLSELRQAFNLFDSDNSGGITIVELKQSLSALGVSITEQEARQMFSAIDVDNNGRIEFEEFAEIVADFYFKKYSRAEILEAFRRFDHNRDGFIEAEELKNILGQLGRNFSNEEIRTMIQKVDRDGNGKISIEEFAALVEKESSQN
ncbi:unnamed protein product [Adineta steineri]|uniref:EF-hand domain-containing protein n=1 Tax=Adineta steineri TaxID=433720 RepID=A0A818PN17_9BILA|nr:unnamed protein product [Adineta steineri]CAF1229953.1 unnamed protein product [Adineta steineri]CAF3628102.1 unnamed protein product [Adineta steineri]CAF3730010.1 unnamed protein product [Adineta steineri]CAF4033559.1 unnamed protein product [Adineta steineri]